ncbi:metalloregulator ArsR/SmtB family transcription factor [Rhodocytophaga aerolata]|uniref:Metalloregulator ArsR/SmtB family transcription factor n=1 Tax=Rhodocytophaga aerolata TaxID=455078 RepID=A0ABT8R5C5_9BACT|nr:metalloregulator ArsR/SmtB family transcription factor [Rhodocytophaga aerolata]MDO1447285.1 metalloregulator ArsR/SmtB family transcription factor [Rhodocytophaga aerolata]
MGVTKTQNFTATQNKVASYAKALAHPARVAIIEYLVKNQTCICGDLVEELPLAQATVSQHLKELKQVGIIKGEIEGTSVCYCLDEKGWGEAREMLLQVLNAALPDKRCC